MPFVEKWKPQPGDTVSLRQGATVENDFGTFVYPQDFIIVGIDKRSGLVTVQDETSGLSGRVSPAALLPVVAPRVLPQKPAKGSS